jgi:hypothetical protein
MRKKILAICAALVAFAAVPAVASASPELQTSGGAKVVVGTAVKATSVGNIIFTSSLGNYACSTSGMTGELVQNSGSSISVTIKAAQIAGSHAGTTNCPTPIVGITMMKVTSENLHWCLTSVEPGGWKLRGGGCTELPASLKFTFITYNSSFEVIGTCVYERPTSSGPVTGSYNLNTSPLALSTGGGNQFARVAGGSLCASAWTLDFQYKFQSATGGELRVI